LAFGYIPASEDEMVWFMQYNVKLSNGHEGNDPEELKAFCTEMMKDFPEEVKAVLDATDFRNAYIWKTRDFDLIPSFHKDNIVLIGDAAHLALPFTSAGTSNAIADAKCLAECLQQAPDFETAFQNYYQLRSEKVSSHIEQGRVLKKIFLNPKKYSERGFLLPLVAATDNYKKFKDKEQIKIIYFTDPICSTCWITQPILRRLKLEYGDYIEFDYHMGGLLPSWKGFERGGIKTPEDVAKHWEEVNASHKMILDGDVWIEDPLNSSSPPSIAFKAAQLQNNDKAITFLRRLKEFVFLQKRNITRWKIIENAALSSGLDAALLKKDIVSNGFKLFKEDLALTKEMNVEVFPTFFFKKNGIVKNTIKGYEPYDIFEDIIKELIPEAKKKTELIAPEAVFAMFHNMTEEEYAFVTNTPLEETRLILNQLHEQLIINKYDTKYGVVWMFNLNSSI
jgi:predicted DsbA family dithiol-disulfide isomerase